MVVAQCRNHHCNIKVISTDESKNLSLTKPPVLAIKPHALFQKAQVFIAKFQINCQNQQLKHKIPKFHIKFQLKNKAFLIIIVEIIF